MVNMQYPPGDRAGFSMHCLHSFWQGLALIQPLDHHALGSTASWGAPQPALSTQDSAGKPG